MKGLKIERIILIIIWLLIAIVFSTQVYVNLFHFTYKMNSDIGSDVILARLIWESKEWIPDSWYVATETRIFTTPNIAALLYGITGNMNLSAGIACIILTLGILISGYFLVKTMKMSPVAIGIFLLMIIILPNNFMVLELLYLFASYYAIHTIILFSTVAMYARAIEGKTSIGVALLGMLLTFLLGLQGVRGILVISGPLFLVELLRVCYILYCKEKLLTKELGLLLWTFLLNVTGLIGSLFPFSVGQSFSRNIRKAPEKFIEQIVPDMLTGTGMSHAAGIEKYLLIIIYGLVIGIGVFLIYRMVRKQKIDTLQWIYMVLVVGPLAAAVVLTFTTVESSGRYFFGFIFAAGISLAMLWQRNETKSKVICVSILFCLFILHYNKIYLPIIESSKTPENDSYKVVKYLEEIGIDQGYASFEHANTMTVYSNGRIRIAAIDKPSEMNICKWVTSTDWYVPNVPVYARTAYIITEREVEEFGQFLEKHENTVEKLTQIGIYHIYESAYNYSNLN